MEEIGQLVAGLEQLVRAYGAAAVLVIVMLEAFGVPLPGETLLIFSAVLAGRGEMWASAFRSQGSAVGSEGALG